MTALVLQPASRGVAVGCLVWVFASFGCECRDLLPAARVKSGNSGPNADFRVYRLNDLETQFLALSAFPELADIGRRSKASVAACLNTRATSGLRRCIQVAVLSGA